MCVRSSHLFNQLMFNLKNFVVLWKDSVKLKHPECLISEIFKVTNLEIISNLFNFNFPIEYEMLRGWWLLYITWYHRLT